MAAIRPRYAGLLHEIQFVQMYEIFEHTADFGIRARADSLNELFADAARGLLRLIVTNLDIVRTVEEAKFSLQGDSREDLLHDWLSELLYTFAVRHLVLCEFHVQTDGARLVATARGEPIDLTRHKIDVEVKAITWHALKVEQNADGWLAEVIVDV
jgi:SHS2 domain-containing protein